MRETGRSLRILLIGNFEPDKSESMQRFCELLRAGLTESGDHVDVLKPQPVVARLWKKDGALRKWLGYLDKYLLFPFHLMARRRGYDVIHICDHSNSMYTRYLGGYAHAVTCHDMMAVKSGLGLIPENPTGRTGQVLQRTILNGLRRAQYIICVSNKTKLDLLQLAGRNDANTSSITLSLNYPYSPMPHDEAMERVKRLLPQPEIPFFIHVGSDSWYKNRPGVVEIFARIKSRPEGSGYKMVMAGKPFPSALLALVIERGLQEEIVQLPGVSNEDLRALYSVSAGLIFPSLDEGFGWPVLEAQACGCQVFTSNRPPMNEIAGAAGIFFDPLDPDAASGIILDGMKRRDEMVAQGFRNMERHTPAAFIAAHRETYYKLTSGTQRAISELV